MTLIRAAGGIVWRPGPRGPQLAVIHRPHRGDWTLPKGKLEPGERWEQAALREVGEETGCLAQLAAFASASFYTSRRGPKLVLFWHMVLVGEGAPPEEAEVDEVAWLSPAAALHRLDHERDRAVLTRASCAARALVRVPPGSTTASPPPGARARERGPRRAVSSVRNA